MISNKRFSNQIQIKGCYTRLNMSPDFCQRSTNKLVSLTHEADFIFRF